MFKSIIYTILILIVLYLISFGLSTREDLIINEYQPQNEYEETYPISDYVDNATNASSFMQRTIIKGMIDSEDFINENNNIKRLKLAGSYVFNRDYRANQLINQVQYDEQELLVFDELPIEEQNEYHNYGYTGYDKDGNEVSGYASLYDVDGNYSIAISFLNSDYTVNQDKALLLADDSNAEKMTYDIIRETQELYGTDLTPEQAAQKFYSSSIEEIAGAISYHAIVTLIIDKYNVESDALERAATTDISLVDSDAFFVNRRY